MFILCFLNAVASLITHTIRTTGNQKISTSKNNHDNTECGPIIASEYAISAFTCNNICSPIAGKTKIPRRIINAKINCRKPRKNVFHSHFCIFCIIKINTILIPFDKHLHYPGTFLSSLNTDRRCWRYGILSTQKKHTDQSDKQYRDKPKYKFYQHRIKKFHTRQHQPTNQFTQFITNQNYKDYKGLPFVVDNSLKKVYKELPFVLCRIICKIIH